MQNWIRTLTDNYVELDGARVHLPEEKQQALRANNVEPQDITLGIRPEHIMLCSDDAAAHISATVDVSEMMGSSVHLHVNANGKDGCGDNPHNRPGRQRTADVRLRKQGKLYIRRQRAAYVQQGKREESHLNRITLELLTPPITGGFFNSRFFDPNL